MIFYLHNRYAKPAADGLACRTCLWTMSVVATTSYSPSLTVDINYSTEAPNCTTTSSGDNFNVAVEVNLWSLLLIAFPLATVFGNALVCVSVCTERSLQTVTNYFIVSLAIADLMVALLVMPLAVYVEVSADYISLHTFDNYWNNNVNLKCLDISLIAPFYCFYVDIMPCDAT